MQPWMRSLERAVEWRRSIGLVEAFDATAFMRSLWDDERDPLAMALGLEGIEFDTVTRDDSNPAVQWEQEREKQDVALAAKALDDCSVVWVSPELCALVDVAAERIDSTRLDIVLPFKSFGYVEFAQPVARDDPDDDPIERCLWAVVDGQVFVKDDDVLFHPYVDKTLRALWVLMEQRIVTTSEAHPDRKLWRRFARGGLVDVPSLRIITLRRAKTDSSDGAGSVAWSHRWLVDGHWREQWYPSLSQHRPVWISEHVKGPEHLPLARKRSIYKLVR